MSKIKKEKKGAVRAKKVRISRDASTGAFVIRALSDPKWDYRTAEGIAKDVKKPLTTVEMVLESDDRVRKSVMKSKSGRNLYTLKVRKSKVGDFFSAFQSLNSDKLKG